MWALEAGWDDMAVIFVPSNDHQRREASVCVDTAKHIDVPCPVSNGEAFFAAGLVLIMVVLLGWMAVMVFRPVTR